ncbi:MAG: alpha-amylase family glycosyl hydrolase [Ferruginibacter sp.]
MAKATTGKSTATAAEKNYKKRLQTSADDILMLYNRLYKDHPDHETCYKQLLQITETAFLNRTEILRQQDLNKLKQENGHWFLSNTICGMSLYVDRFCGNLSTLKNKLDYFKELGINLLHLMPVFESPADESDGGYAVSNFRKVDERFGHNDDLVLLEQQMQKQGMYLMLDIVLNHTSQKHEWAVKARNGEKKYQDYFYFFDDRNVPDELEKTMPEIFPESSPGSFTYVPELNKWVMSVFHSYQWDLNFRNPAVFNEMMENIFFYANLGVDILRIDAPAFIWKEKGTASQNLDEAHCLLQLIKQCVQVATPGMALLGEAIVAPVEIMKYFGTGDFVARECDLAYNATQMAVQWDALATSDTRIMLAAQESLLQKPFGTTWITYTRCHDDIGLGYDDTMIARSGYEPYQHRKFMQNYYSGNFEGSVAMGALFSVNDKTGDARISGSLASLCGLEYALKNNNANALELAVKKIILMQAQSFFIGGIPMIFYGDELGYTNDYSYQEDNAKSYDNRWMHRPIIDSVKNKNAMAAGTTENRIFNLTKKLISIRSKIPVVADKKNLTWINTENDHVAGFLRAWNDERVYCIFNFCKEETSISWYTFKQNNMKPAALFDHWSEKVFPVGYDHEHLILQPYQFLILEPR